MAERKKPKSNKKKDKRGDGDPPSKEQKSVAYHVRFNCPTKTTMFNADEAHYFTGGSAVDCLLASKWGSDKSKNQLFSTRKDATSYLDGLLNKGMFFRARKLVAKKKEPKTDSKEDPGPSIDEQGADKEASQKKSPNKAKKDVEKEKENKEKTAEEEEKDTKKNGKDEEKDSKKKPKKVKLDFHADQMFLDSCEAVFVWVYDPTSWGKFILGLLIVFGSIVVCLFPLWPAWLRLGIYYVSLVAMGFVGALTAVVFLRSILFGIIWAVTWGRHHFWLLPNLTEDCGFFESFKPLYTHKLCSDEEKDGKGKGKKEGEKGGSDNESSEGEQPPATPTKGVRRRRGLRRDDGAPAQANEENNSNEESDFNENSNGFEIVN